jgi:hypothetical protein
VNFDYIQDNDDNDDKIEGEVDDEEGEFNLSLNSDEIER